MEDESDFETSLSEDGIYSIQTLNGLTTAEDNSERKFQHNWSTQALNSIAAEEEEDRVPLLIDSSWTRQGILGAKVEETDLDISCPVAPHKSTAHRGTVREESGPICMPVYTLLVNGRMRIDEVSYSTSFDTVRVDSTAIGLLSNL